ncbi:MAG: hypothetical protein WC670_18260 [Pseudolabrys sp.]|jgi:hypothetical protein
MSKQQILGAVISAAAPAASEQQLDLMPPARGNMSVDEQERFEKAISHGRVGRPKGATNLANREMLAFIRKTLGDPMLESARWAMHTPDSLAIVLGCSKAEAFDRLEKLRADLRPYFYAKQAPVDTDGKPVPGLTVEFHGHGAARVGADGQQLPPWLYEGDPTAHEQNQRLIEAEPTVSHASVSHDDK